MVSLFDAAGDAVDAGASSARGGSDVSVSVRLNGLWKPGIARESRVAEWWIGLIGLQRLGRASARRYDSPAMLPARLNAGNTMLGNFLDSVVNSSNDMFPSPSVSH